MSDVQVSAERRQLIDDAHQRWGRTSQGRVIAPLVEGRPVTITGGIAPYSDFEPVRFVSVDPEFIEFLKDQGIAADIINGDTVYTI